jgi:hypothetical protein
MEKPYQEEKINDNTYIRTFLSTIDEMELKWHWDEQDRLVWAKNKTNWKFQFDNCLPQLIDLNHKIFIPKGTIHRVIKGEGNLEIYVTKIDDSTN